MLYVLVLVLSYGLAFVFTLMANLDRKTSLGKYLMTMAGMLFLPLAINLLFAAITAPFHHDGNCYGFTDGKWECGVWDYVILQVDYAFLFTLFFNMIWFGLLTLMCLTNLVLRYLDTRRT